MLANLSVFKKIFHIFFGFLKRLKPSYVFWTIFFDFGGFGRDFGRNLARF